MIAIARLVIEAAAGEDAEAVDARLKAAHPERASRDGWSVVDWTAAALARDRAEANRLSAIFDARAGGPLRLALLTGRCECGAPFDLAATPNFKARIAESGLPWPPPTPIQFPQRTARRK